MHYQITPLHFCKQIRCEIERTNACHRQTDSQTDSARERERERERDARRKTQDILLNKQYMFISRGELDSRKT